jgi:hypothetical protein
MLVTTDQSRLRISILVTAGLELLLLALLLFVLGYTAERAGVALVLIVGLAASHRYFWRRLSGKDAQFFNLFVSGDEGFCDFDKLMIAGHLAAILFGVSLILS